MSDDYTYWREALAGNFGPIHDGDPRPGFYLRKLCAGKGAPLSPVAIWRDAMGELTALQQIIIRPTFVNPSDVWTWAAGWPIPEEHYRSAERLTWPPGLEKYKHRKPA